MIGALVVAVLLSATPPNVSFGGETTVLKGFNPFDPNSGTILTEHLQSSPVAVLSSSETNQSNSVAVVSFDVDNTAAVSPSESVVVMFDVDTGDGFVTEDQAEFFGDEVFSNFTLRSRVMYFPGGTKFRIRISTFNHSTRKPMVFVHPQNHGTFPACVVLHAPLWRVSYEESGQYPAGYTEKLRVALLSPDGNMSGYFSQTSFTVPTSYSSEQMVTGLIPALNSSFTGMGVHASADSSPYSLSIYLDSEPNLWPWFGGHPYGSRSLRGGLFYVMRVP
jgi:hypothetical protein